MNHSQSQQETLVKELRQLLSGKRNATRRSITQSVGSFLGYCGEAYPSQTTLGKKAGVKRETACRSLKTLHNKIIVVSNRGYKKTCQYWYTSEFLNHRNHFYDLIPALRQISLLLLFSITSNVYSQNVTQYKEYIGAQRRSTAMNDYRFIVVDYSRLDFYDPFRKYKKEIVFLKNRQQTAINTAIASKERVMDQSVIQQLAAAFYLNEEQAEQYSNQYSKSVLQKALQSFQKQRTQRVINNPKAWLARVLADEERKEQEKAQHSSNGKQAGHSTNPRNPNGHSPAQELPNLTHMEQIEYLVKEILKFSKTFDPNKVYSRDPLMDEYLKKLAMNSIAGMQREVDQLFAQLDDPSHICKVGCVDQSLFLRKPKQQSDVDFTQPSSDKDYEEHLNAISADKSNSTGYKELVRKYDYGRIAR